MTVEQIEALGPQLDGFLARFGDCFGRREPRAHFGTVVRGQLSNLPRKSIEPIALAAGTPPRTLQKFFDRAGWDDPAMRDRLQQEVARTHAHPHGIGLLDATTYPKKGNHTPGVARQWCGAQGKVENCVCSVHLAYATPAGFRVLLDGELFLPPGTWTDDPDRRQAAGIPPEVTYRSKPQIALDLLDRARANGLDFPWLTFDADFGRPKWFLRQLQARGQRFVGEVPANFCAWSRRPTLYDRPEALGRGLRWRCRHEPPLSAVADLGRYSPVFHRQPWQAYYVRDATDGPLVWEAKFAPVYLRDPAAGRWGPLWLIVARNVLDRTEVKYLLANAPPGCPAAVVLGAGLGRYPIERCFEDQKTELGLDHFEVRHYRSLQRHLILTSVTSLFLAEVVRRDGGEKPGPDGLPSADRGPSRLGRHAPARPGAAAGAAADRHHPAVPATAQRPGGRVASPRRAAPT